jgi:hypothetical protein
LNQQPRQGAQQGRYPHHRTDVIVDQSGVSPIQGSIDRDGSIPKVSTLGLLISLLQSFDPTLQFGDDLEDHPPTVEQASLPVIESVRPSSPRFDQAYDAARHRLFFGKGNQMTTVRLDEPSRNQIKNRNKEPVE